MGKTKELKPVGASVDDVSEDANINGFTQSGYGSMDTVHDSSIEDSTESTNDVVPMTKNLRFFKTVCMLGIYIGLGLWTGVVSTTNVDMVNLYDCTYDEFNRAATMKSLGVMGGSFIGAAITDRFRSKADLFLAIVCFTGGSTILAVPWSPNLVIMGVLFIINGLSHGVSNVVCSSITLAIWGQAAPTPIIALHTCFSVGTSLAPLITAPFLSKVDSNNTDVKVFPTELNSSLIYLTESSTVQNNSTSTHVRIPYGMFGLWSIIVGGIFLAFFLSGSVYTDSKAKKKESIRAMLNPAKCANGDIIFGLYFIISLLFMYIFINGRDRCLPQFLFAIAHKELGMTKPMSALLLTSYSFLSALARGLCAVISKFVRIQIVLFVEVVMALLLQMYLVFYGLESPTALWLLTCSLVMFSAPTYPTVMAWADRYVEVTGAVVAMIDIGIGLGGFVALMVAGVLFQNKGSQAVLTLTFILGILLTSVYAPMQILSHIRGDRHKSIPRVHSINISAQMNNPSEPNTVHYEDDDDTRELIS